MDNSIARFSPVLTRSGEREAGVGVGFVGTSPELAVKGDSRSRNEEESSLSAKLSRRVGDFGDSGAGGDGEEGDDCTVAFGAYLGVGSTSEAT